MASQDHQHIHVVFIPLMAQGHMIPMMDIARLFARRGVMVTIITTPLNASRFQAVIDREMQAGLQIELVQFPFPCKELGLPQGCDNVDLIPSQEMAVNFLKAVDFLQHPVEQFLQEHQTPVSCIISDTCLPWTCETASKFQIPRIAFHGTCCFSLLSMLNIHCYKPYKTVASELEPFVIPGLPHRIEITKSQLLVDMNANLELQQVNEKLIEGDLKSYGVVVNSFEELEPEYVESYQKACGKKVWTVGPVSLCNTEIVDRAERGNKASIDEHECLSWLDSRKPRSVVYACFGSISILAPSHLIEIGLGLEASKHTFIWVIRKDQKCSEVEEWLSGGFEERVKERALIIRGWAPQMLILSHAAIGGFLSHCGWNSTLESISVGVPMIACPVFAEQFFNEKLIVHVLKTGVSVGVKAAIKWGQEKRVFVKMEEVKKAVERLMDEGEEGEERRKRARELGEKARSAMEEGGSSYNNITLLIQDIINLANKNWNAKGEA
ncbi:UDP-glycosyltransferase 73C3-like [Magnolia sinica]|uniref:UDP-glycosyltransferase 73C3-like n=1 Tax=Magnolia sinica TaxID=86752 RepID=UPI002658129B|nr:UDP-glycosyltransferase 73C3-like [Magnolia sinica]